MPDFLKLYSETEAEVQASLDNYRAQMLDGTISKRFVDEAQARAWLDQYLEMILDARELMKQRGIPEADFPDMFNALLRRVDQFSESPNSLET